MPGKGTATSSIGFRPSLVQTTVPATKQLLIGIWADGFEKLQFIPMLVVTPLTFLGGSFYSIDMLPPFWRTLTLFNPVVYLVGGFRWSFYGVSDVGIETSLGICIGFFVVCLGLTWWIFKTGYRLKQ